MISLHLQREIRRRPPQGLLRAALLEARVSEVVHSPHSAGGRVLRTRRDRSRGHETGR